MIFLKLRGELKGDSEQISYERSSQTQSLTIPPKLLTAAGYFDFAGWRFKFVKQESLN